MRNHPDTPANEIFPGISHQPATNYATLNDALLSNSGLNSREASQAMDAVPDPEAGAKIRMVSYNREGVPPYGTHIGEQNSKHFEINIIPESEKDGNPFFAESNTYTAEIMGDAEYGFQSMFSQPIGQPLDTNEKVHWHPHKGGAPAPLLPVEGSYLAPAFVNPKMYAGSLGGPNIIVVSENRQHSDVRSLHNFHVIQKAKESRDDKDSGNKIFSWAQKNSLVQISRLRSPGQRNSYLLWRAVRTQIKERESK